MSDSMTIERKLRKTGDYEAADEIMRLQARVAKLENPEPCIWLRDEDMHGTEYWNQSCGNFPFVFANGGPAQSKFQFCPNCGRPLEVSDE
jgi:hypothetical protein